jgi:hypothetical protein
MMYCKCGGRLLARNTFSIREESAITRDHKCDKCGRRQTSVSFLVLDRDREGGAKEMAKRIKKGDVWYETKND